MEKPKLENDYEEKSSRFISLLKNLSFLMISFNVGFGFYSSQKLSFVDLYFLQTCPNCAERMKYMRKISSGALYTCYTCYQSWLRKNKFFVETKLTTK